MISKEDFIFPRGTVRVGLTQPKILLVLAAALLLAALCLVLAVHLKYGSASVTVGADGGRNESSQLLSIISRAQRSQLGGNDQHYYGLSWECSSVDGVAFVDGGMNFSASDQSLQVPQSGYYFISSQVYFQVDKSVAQNRAVFHQVLVNSNCNANSRSRVYSQSYASPADGSVELPTVTTHSSLVVKLCTGGKIKVVVPKPPAGSVQGAPCCPYSLSTATFFDVYLISYQQ
ncbi:hypothetical protein EMCRGX_G026166 [Ephydatia muelleri]